MQVLWSLPSFLSLLFGFSSFLLIDLCITYFFWMHYLKIFSHTFSSQPSRIPMCMSIINSWVPILTILFHQITRCQSSVQIYLEFFIYKKAIPKHFFLSKIKTMICFLFIYILFLHASHFDWSMSRICQNHYNDRDSCVCVFLFFAKFQLKFAKYIYILYKTLVCAQSHPNSWAC